MQKMIFGTSYQLIECYYTFNTYSKYAQLFGEFSPMTDKLSTKSEEQYDINLNHQSPLIHVKLKKMQYFDFNDQLYR